ncbi:hypothetical protein FRC02_008600 [Tulasnella sp. 418]|nr:hypothetical protein FRC02_008600 [Tulasnella sp. 418]
MIPAALKNTILLLLLGTRLVYSASNIDKVLVHPEELRQEGYWGATYHGECDIQLYEGYGANAGLSFEFEGSGVVVRLLHCSNCAQVEITIDNSMSTTVNLSVPNDVNDGFKCPQDAPSFFFTKLEHTNHVIEINRLDSNLDHEFKVLELEYLKTNKEKADFLSGLLLEAKKAGRAVKGVAEDAANAFDDLKDLGVQYIVDNVIKWSSFRKEGRESDCGSYFKCTEAGSCQPPSWRPCETRKSGDGD